MEELLSLEQEEATGVLPEFLSESVTEYRVSTRKGSTLAGDYWEQLRSFINVADTQKRGICVLNSSKIFNIFASERQAFQYNSMIRGFFGEHLKPQYRQSSDFD